ncbi:unnamed protein product, partial [Mesorhabditis belari]|uniref:Uncharacterized protein n=1 Tax=Mesorhabditis belari TaxID=2138241 RepID=A0AAF3FEA5_9BILA
MTAPNTPNITHELMCGATAGVAVDLGLYPLDTLKTRLQSKQGFRAAGGFRNLYRGMSSVAIGSAPGSAIFFVSYRQAQKMGNNSILSDILAACFGEMCACLVRVPTELLKQRIQASNGKLKLSSAIREIRQTNGFFGFYRGFTSTIVREIPFAFIEYPLWEAMKRSFHQKMDRHASPIEGAAFGSLAGLTAAALTTPLDVAKTRIMLNRATYTPRILETLFEIHREGGVRALFSGIVPRMCWMSIGGFVFFGAYETAKYTLSLPIEF